MIMVVSFLASDVGGYQSVTTSGKVDAMSATVRERINLTVTPHLAEVLQRNALAGEPKTSTVARLIERGDALAQQERRASGQLAALDELAGMISYPSGYLGDLRSDWDSRP